MQRYDVNFEFKGSLLLSKGQAPPMNSHQLHVSTAAVDVVAAQTGCSNGWICGAVDMATATAPINTIKAWNF